jgi:hypothetical protein
MPLQVDHSKPVRTVDTRGKVISTDTRTAAPQRSIDSVGRAIKAEAARGAEELAATNPDLKAKADSGGPQATPKEGGEKPKEAAKEEEQPSEAKLRKEWLEVQKAKRKGAEFLKMAKAKLADAEGYAEAKRKVESGDDPMALIRFAGLDPVKNYADVTKYALSDKAKQEEDPAARERREHKERLDAYEKRLAEQEAKILEREETTAKEEAIQKRVEPLLRSTPDDYECLFAQYGDGAAAKVFETTYEIWKETGQARSFKDVADELEKFYTDNIGQGIEKIVKLKKFQGRFTQVPKESSDKPQDQPEKPQRSVTLSNKPHAPPPVESSENKRPDNWATMTRDERQTWILFNDPRFKDIP